MSGISISDKTHEEIYDLAHEMRTNMKTITEKMWKFVSKRQEEFIEEMF